MNLLDLLIATSASAFAVGGYRLGFLARFTSWIGFGLGLFVGTRLLPAVLDALEDQAPGTRLAIAAGVLIGGAFLGQGMGLLVGVRMHHVVPHGGWKTADRSVGAALGVIGVLMAVWLLVLPVMSEVPGWPARQARSSVIARALDRRAPRPPDALSALRGLVGDTTFPRVFDTLRPAPETGPPPSELPMDQATRDRVVQSTVKVEGEACQRIQEGSGFTVGPDTVVTNAHVVAGVRNSLQVERPDGRSLPARVVSFDSDRDLAILQVRNLGQAPLGIGVAKPQQRAAVFGHPGGQDEVRVAPANISQQVDAVGRDLYDRHQTRRDVFILAASLRPGDSGGALVDAKGAVVGVAFAIAPDEPGTAYAVTSKELNAALAAPRSAATTTGKCLREA